MRPGVRPACFAPGHNPVCWGMVRGWLTWMASPGKAETRTFIVDSDGGSCAYDVYLKGGARESETD